MRGRRLDQHDRHLRFGGPTRSLLFLRAGRANLANRNDDPGPPVAACPRAAPRSSDGGIHRDVWAVTGGYPHVLTAGHIVFAALLLSGACSWEARQSGPPPPPVTTTEPPAPFGVVKDQACERGVLGQVCNDVHVMAIDLIEFPGMTERLEPSRIVVTPDRRVRYEAKLRRENEYANKRFTTTTAPFPGKAGCCRRTPPTLPASPSATTCSGTAPVTDASGRPSAYERSRRSEHFRT